MTSFFSLMNFDSNVFSMELTNREKEIADLIYAELTTYEISKKLGISVKTVESHRKNIYLKLNVKTVVGLVKRWKN